MNESYQEPPLSVGILAGGNSVRMGANKALLPYGDGTVIETILKELGAFSELLVSAAQKGVYESLGVPVCYDERSGIGPIEGIRMLLSNAKEEYVFVCAADMPSIKKELVHYIARFISPDYDCYVLTDGQYMEPLCAVYSKRVLPAIEQTIARGEYRIRVIFKTCPVKYIPLESSGFDKNVIRNINTRQDYLEAGGTGI